MAAAEAGNKALEEVAVDMMNFLARCGPRNQDATGLASMNALRRDVCCGFCVAKTVVPCDMDTQINTEAIVDRTWEYVAANYPQPSSPRLLKWDKYFAYFNDHFKGIQETSPPKGLKPFASLWDIYKQAPAAASPSSSQPKQQPAPTAVVQPLSASTHVHQPAPAAAASGGQHQHHQPVQHHRQARRVQWPQALLQSLMQKVDNVQDSVNGLEDELMGRRQLHVLANTALTGSGQPGEQLAIDMAAAVAASILITRVYKHMVFSSVDANSKTKCGTGQRVQVVLAKSAKNSSGDLDTTLKLLSAKDNVAVYSTLSTEKKKEVDEAKKVLTQYLTLLQPRCLNKEGEMVTTLAKQLAQAQAPHTDFLPVGPGMDDGLVFLLALQDFPLIAYMGSHNLSQLAAAHCRRTAHGKKQVVDVEEMDALAMTMPHQLGTEVLVKAGKLALFRGNTVHAGNDPVGQDPVVWCQDPVSQDPVVWCQDPVVWCQNPVGQDPVVWCQDPVVWCQDPVGQDPVVWCQDPVGQDPVVWCQDPVNQDSVVWCQDPVVWTLWCQDPVVWCQDPVGQDPVVWCQDPVVPGPCGPCGARTLWCGARTLWCGARTLWCQDPVVWCQDPVGQDPVVWCQDPVVPGPCGQDPVVWCQDPVVPGPCGARTLWCGARTLWCQDPVVWCQDPVGQGKVVKCQDPVGQDLVVWCQDPVVWCQDPVSQWYQLLIPQPQKAPLGYDSPTLQTLPGSNREEYVLIYDVRMKFTHEQIMSRGAPFIHGWSQGDPRVVGCHAQPLLPLLLQHLDARLAHLVPVYHGFMYGLLKHQLEWFMSADGLHIDVRREILKRGAAIQSPSDLGRNLGDLANRTGWRMEDYKHWFVHFSPIVLRGNLLPEPYRGLWTALEGAMLHYLTPGSCDTGLQGPAARLQGPATQVYRVLPHAYRVLRHRSTGSCDVWLQGPGARLQGPATFVYRVLPHAYRVLRRLATGSWRTPTGSCDVWLQGSAARLQGPATFGYRVLPHAYRVLRRLATGFCRTPTGSCHVWLQGPGARLQGPATFGYRVLPHAYRVLRRLAIGFCRTPTGSCHVWLQVLPHAYRVLRRLATGSAARLQGPATFGYRVLAHAYRVLRRLATGFCRTPTGSCDVWLQVLPQRLQGPATFGYRVLPHAYRVLRRLATGFCRTPTGPATFGYRVLAHAYRVLRRFGYRVLPHAYR
ncbi:hypothetical protein V8C86DRAFT_2447375, partial [Haematococcus lacustris]